MTKYLVSYIPGNVGTLVTSEKIRPDNMSEKEVLAIVKGILGMPAGKKMDQKTFEKHGGVRLLDPDGKIIFKARQLDQVVKKTLTSHPPWKQKFLSPLRLVPRVAVAA